MPAGTGSIVAGSSGSNWGLMSGVTGSGGWAKNWMSSSLRVRYAAGYSRRDRFLDSQQIFQNLNISYFAHLRLGTRWLYTAQLTGRIVDLESYLLLPASPDELAALAIASGVDPLDPTLSVTPANFGVFGRRLLTANLGNTFTLRKSERLSYRIGLNASRTQFLGSRDNSATADTFVNGVVNAGVNAGLTYALTPRTQMNANLMVARSFSSFFNAGYFTNATVGLGRQMNPWWRLQGQAGVGYNLSTNGVLPSRPRAIGGVSSSFSAYQQNLSLSVAVTAFDPFGIGAGTTLAGAARWSWHRPAARWALMATAMQTMSRQSTVGTFSAWSASTGLNYVITDQLFLTLSGGYTNVSGLANFGGLGGLGGGGLGGFGNRFGYRGVRLALTWAPTKIRW